MEKQKFTFRQKWFPTLGDADELERVDDLELTRRREGRGERGEDRGERVVHQLLCRWARSLVLVGGVLIWGGYQGIGNNIEHSEGQKDGFVNKISEKGLIWKTKEGQLSLGRRTRTGDYTVTGVWNFSIDGSAKHGENVDELYSQIRKEMEDGQRVMITYKKQLATWPWRAGTTYLVQSVESLETKTK